jgi:lipopolysaccharide biosynthesis glycosyltransferase
LVPICTKPWTRLYVTADGQCWNCCYQKHPFHIITKENEPFEDVWNNVNIQHIRSKLINSEMPHFCDCLNKRGSIPDADIDASIPFAKPIIFSDLIQIGIIENG